MKIFLEFNRNDDSKEPFLIELDEIAGVNPRGLIIKGGGEVHTTQTYPEIVATLANLPDIDSSQKITPSVVVLVQIKQNKTAEIPPQG